MGFAIRRRAGLVPGEEDNDDDDDDDDNDDEIPSADMPPAFATTPTSRWGLVRDFCSTIFSVKTGG